MTEKKSKKSISQKTAESAPMQSQTNITECVFTAVQWDEKSTAAINELAKAINQNAMAITTNAEAAKTMLQVFQAQNIQIEALLKVGK